VPNNQLKEEPYVKKKETGMSSEGILKGINVLHITTGHYATDHRIYSKMACSLKHMGANVIVVGMREHNIPGKVKVIGIPKSTSKLERLFWQPWRCLLAARQFNADIVHFHETEILIALPFAKLLWPRRKFVYDVHEDFSNLLLVIDWLPSNIKGIVRVLTNFFEKGLTVMADAIVGVTPPLTDKFKNKKRITAFNFTSREFFEQVELLSRTPLKREFDLVHLGTLNFRRAMFLVETIKEFHKYRPKARSLIVGALPEISKKIGPELPDNCQLIGKIPHHKIPELLGNAKVGLDIHPWLGPHLDVALPVKVCEYMASKCAVVSSTMPVLNQILAKDGNDLNGILVIESDDPVVYAKAVVKMIETIERGENPGLELREFALRNMVWEKEAHKIAKLYLELLGKPCVI
jgi:glycosyltransferase involved in cell wall biosynthesis